MGGTDFLKRISFGKQYTNISDGFGSNPVVLRAKGTDFLNVGADVANGERKFRSNREM